MYKLKKNRLQQSGFTLVEIMVGLVIGLIAVLVITQAMHGFEGRKGITAGNADAQTNGSIALYEIQREVQQAGFGLPIFDGDPTNATLNNASILNCTLPFVVDHDKNAVTPSIDIFPIEITDGGAGASDSVTVRYGTSETAGLATKGSYVTSTKLGVDTNYACADGDIFVLVSSAAPVCRTGVATDVDAAPMEVIFTPVTPAPAIGIGRVSCLGQRLQEVTFSIAIDAASGQSNLMRADLNAANVIVNNPILADIVDIQAQYGISNNSKSNDIARWVNATGVWAGLDVAGSNTNATCDATNANRNCIRAVRLAVVARNAKRENAAVTTVCSSTTAANPTGLCAWDATSANPANASPAPSLAINLGTDAANYRYRVYETILPIRNLTYSGSLL